MRYLITFAYDGSKYSGYQKQPDVKTVQGELERVLTTINNNQDVLVSASGRTDAGVHALNQKAHFDLTIDITADKLKLALNSLLPKDIYVKVVEEVSSDFHARFNVKAKEYIYKINMGEYNPIEKDYIYQYNKKLDIEAIEKALILFQGTHDFKSFTKANDEKDDYVRTIVRAKLEIDGNNPQLITISFLGTGFLRYMVRNIVGLLIEIGEGKRLSSQVVDVLEACDRRCAGITARPEGLYLKDVYYENGNILEKSPSISS
ncbi:MAG: tRNA pseudouridine(38-40) synthase TruA [Firmicutes bacterium]|nr:tRNA pseudouridine(38-40) synthase TruA [Bacillota bacterium]